MSASMVDSAGRTDAAIVADALLRARRDARPADASALAATLHDATGAYAVQDLVARALQGPATGFPRFWKSGGPSRDAVLTHAALPANGVWPSPADARAWHCNIRLIEVELALRLGRDVTAAEAGRLTPATAASLVDGMAVSIELVDSRWQQGVQAPPLLKLADLQSHGALVLGDWQPFSPRDWAHQECTVRIGAGPIERRHGTHALGDPLWVLPEWLRHLTRSGAVVPAGTVVTTGTWCGMLPAEAGDLVVACFEGVGQASLQL
jgi:2-keto-4-pentenoate hydratase